VEACMRMTIKASVSSVGIGGVFGTK